MVKTLKWLVVIICFYYSIVNIISPIALSEDTAVGLMCIKNIENGGAFNCISQPTGENIALDKEVFISTWSPAHYLIPYLFFKIGFSAGNSYLIVVIICLVFGLIGMYKLLRKFNVPELYVWLTLLLLITNRSNFNTNFYNLGMGEMLAFASLPWYALIMFRLERITIVSVLIISACTFLMIMIKLSLLIACAATILFFAYKKFKEKRITVACIYAIPFLIAFGAFKITFQNKGVDSSQLKGGIYKHTKLENSFVASAAPLASIINLSDIEDESIPSKIRETYFAMKPFVFFLISVAVVLILLLLKNKLKNHHDLVLLFVCFYTVFALAYFLFSIKENWMDYTYRHFRFYSILFIPILCIGFQEIFNRKKTIAFAGIILIATYGIATFSYKKLIVNKNLAQSDGFAYNYYDKDALAELKRLDDSLKTGNNLFYVTSPEAANTIKNNRQMVSLETYSVGVKYGWTHYNYKGTVDNLYIFAENRFFYLPTQKKILFNLFSNYNLEEVKKTKNVTIFKAINKN
jgi:hypothetical protein